MTTYKAYILPALADPLWIHKENELADNEEQIEKEEQEIAKYYTGITNCESSFVAPGFERKEESEEEEEGSIFLYITDRRNGSGRRE